MLDSFNEDSKKIRSGTSRWPRLNSDSIGFADCAEIGSCCAVRLRKASNSDVCRICLQIVPQ
jgi:hypothetical protein